MTPAGKATIGGDPKSDFNRVSGAIRIESRRVVDHLDQWIEEADAEIRRILDVVSFADRHYMRPVACDVYFDESLVHTDLYGRQSASPARHPPLHCLDYSNSLPSLIEKYTPDLIARTGLDVAIEWHVMDHR